jgi:pterin-4a-carbinolamine dehydratase
MIFISYRRKDSLEFCKSMAAELRGCFGDESVFFDQTIDRGAEWPTTVRNALNTARVVLFVIGPKWLHAKVGGRRRINIGGDWVREEMLTVLKRKQNGDEVQILPVLMPNVAMPKDLCDELLSFLNFQALPLPNTGKPEDFDELKDQLMRWNFLSTVLAPVATPRIGKLPRGLNPDDESAFLKKMKGWRIVETREPDPIRFRRELHRVYEFRSFEDAFRFMNEVVEREINVHDHHPRWQNFYTRVEVWLTTSNLGCKLSTRDVRLAEVCEQIWSETQGALKSRPKTPTKTGDKRRRAKS